MPRNVQICIYFHCKALRGSERLVKRWSAEWAGLPAKHNPSIAVNACAIVKARLMTLRSYRMLKHISLLLLCAGHFLVATAEQGSNALSAGSMALMPKLARSMDDQEAEARNCIAKWKSTPKDRLAAVYLHAHSKRSYREVLIGCSIDRLLSNVGQDTPIDIFVFARKEVIPRMSDKLSPDKEDPGRRICMIPIPEIQWEYQLPRVTPYLLPNNTNRYRDYLVMGQWRLLVPFNVMAAVGYPYVLQLDDDLFVAQPFKYNIVEHMKKNNYKFANHRVSTESWQIMWGLPELARFYMLSNHIEPKSMLFKHLHPPNIHSLFSPRHSWHEPGSPRLGYGLTVLLGGRMMPRHNAGSVMRILCKGSTLVEGDAVLAYLGHLQWGNFLVMSTELWRKPEVQDWVALSMSSGGLERHRWQEQGVMAFIWLMFTNEEEFWYLTEPEFDYIHGRDPDRTNDMCGFDVYGAFVLGKPRLPPKNKDWETIVTNW